MSVLKYTLTTSKNDYHMTKQEIIYSYNKKVGNIVPGLQPTSDSDFISLSNMIDNSREISFKFSLFPSEMFERLLDFTDVAFAEELMAMESLINDKMR